MLARPPVVWALAVFSTFSSRFISPASHEGSSVNSFSADGDPR
jgi:hypothetical protein